MHSPFSLSTLPHGREGAEEATSLTQFPSGRLGQTVTSGPARSEPSCA